MQALHDVSLEIADGDFVVFVGPSGCGKSTLLRAIAGLESVSSGLVSIGGEEMTDAAPSDRNVAMVFQSYALYPHMTVRENMEFGLKVNGVPEPDREVRIQEAGPHPATIAVSGPETRPAFRWPAPAGGDRAGDRAATESLPVRRTTVKP